jgi:hypothetical protein
MSTLRSRLRKHVPALATVALVVLLAVLGTRPVTRHVRTDQEQADKTVGELLPGRSVGQTFVAEYGGVSRIEVMLTAYNRLNSGDLVFELRSAEDDSGALVRQRFGAADVAGNMYFPFDFDPIWWSEGRSFLFSIEALEGHPGDAITACGFTRDVYLNGEAVLVDLPGTKVRDLTFRLTYTMSPLNKVGALLDRLTRDKPSAAGSRCTYVVLGGTYLALIYKVVDKLSGA